MFELTIEGREARIVIDRGTRRNAVPVACWSELERCVRAAGNSKAQLVTIASADPDSFCAGADMVELAGLERDERARRAFRGSLESAFGWIRQISKPTVALVSGGCFGVGVGLATACDIRIARPDASFAITPARFGLSYPEADIESLVRLVGPGQTARLIYASDVIDGREAHRIGLVEIVDDSPELGRELIDRIAAASASSLYSLKSTMLGRPGCKKRFDESFGSLDFQKAVDPFRRERAPAAERHPAE